MVGESMESLYGLDSLSTCKTDPHKSITDVVLFYWASNGHIGSEIFKIHYPNISVMCGVEHTVSLFFNHVFQNTSCESDDYNS